MCPPARKHAQKITLMTMKITSATMRSRCLAPSAFPALIRLMATYTKSMVNNSTVISGNRERPLTLANLERVFQDQHVADRNQQDRAQA